MNSNKLKLKIIERLMGVPTKKDLSSLPEGIEWFDDSNISILDAGCGEGIISNHLYKLGYKNIIAFDVDEMRIKTAIATQVPVMKECPIKYFVSSVEKADYSNHDIIISWVVLIYVKDIKGVLKKMYNEMKDGSTLIFAVPNACSLNKRIRCLFGKNPIQNKKRVTTYTFKEVENLLNETGFDVFGNNLYSKSRIYGDRYDIFKGKMLPVFFKKFSNKIIVKCRK